MAFGRLEDTSGSIEFVVFPKTFAQFEALLVPDTAVLIKGKVEEREDALSLITEKILAPSQSSIQKADHELFIPRKTSKKTLEKIGSILKSNPGSDTIAILIPNGEQPKTMLLPYKVGWSQKLAQEIQALLAWLGICR